MANHTKDCRQTYEELEQRIHELTTQLKSQENREYKSRFIMYPIRWTRQEEGIA